MAFAKFVAILLILSGLRSVAAADPVRKSEAEFLVPPQGSAVEVPVHVGEVCILSFPEKLASRALGSSLDYEVNPWEGVGVAVRATSNKASTSTLALSTVSGAIKVNITLRVVPANADGYTLVRFKAATAQEAFDATVAAAVAKQMAPVQAELAAMNKKIDAQIRDRADRLIAERMLRRREPVALNAHRRNTDHVIAHVLQGFLLGEDGYIFFDLENRSSAAYRLATVRVLADGRDVAGPASLRSGAIDRDPGGIGVVAAGATGHGVVTVRSVDSVLGKPLVLELAGPDGRGVIAVDRGIELR